MLKEAVVNTLEIVGGLAITRYLTRRKPRILMYHRVVDSPLLPGISPKLFEAQLIYLKKNFNVVSLNELLANVKKKTEKDYQVAVTFDDGHHDFYTHAWPILRKHGVPATLFTTTGFVDKKVWLWPDLLRMIILAAPPNNYRLDGLGEIALTRENPLHVWNTIADYCLTLSHAGRMVFITDLAFKMNVSVDAEPQEPFAPVSWSELREMKSEGLDIGSHSDTHPILSDLSDEELIIELEYSKQRISEEIGIPPTGICYPNGMAKDVSVKVEERARQFYEYGLVAYPAEIAMKNIMHLGRYAASSNISRFKLLINGASFHVNHAGEYK